MLNWFIALFTIINHSVAALNKRTKIINVYMKNNIEGLEMLSDYLNNKYLST
jgi:hypothetical protein